MRLTSYLVDAQIPDELLAWVQSQIHSPLVFLLVLNVLLLVLGSVLEIYSAIIILAPLIAPMGLAFGVDPIHLGVIFLANLELGFLFPPGGLESLSVVVAVQEAAAAAVPARAAVPHHPGNRRPADHLHPRDVRRRAAAVREVG
jgi:TRAP-type C4-dicarboxylate transport system permease large subunit